MARFPAWLQRVSAVLVLAVVAPLGAAEKFKAPLVLPGGGVADPAGKVGYFPNPAGGIDALDLANGKLLWETKEANRPLLATGGRLFAPAAVKGAANQVRVVVLDTAKKGKRLLQARPVVFPDWVAVSVAYGRSFDSTARLDKESLLLIWEARAWYAGGARPSQEVEKAARKNASGVARINLRSGKVETLAGDKIPKGVPQQVPGEVRTAKVGERVYSILDERAGNPRHPFQMKRTLKAVDGKGKLLWERAIAPPVYLPPRK